MDESPRRYNFYYIFKEDFENQKLPDEVLEQVKNKIFQIVFPKDKTESDSDSS